MRAKQKHRRWWNEGFLWIDDTHDDASPSRKLRENTISYFRSIVSTVVK